MKALFTCLLLCMSLVATTQDSRVMIINDTAAVVNDLDTAIILAHEGYKIFYVIGNSQDSILNARFEQMPRDKLIGFNCDNCHLKSLPKYFKQFTHLNTVSLSWYLGDYPYEQPVIVERVFGLKYLDRLSLHGIPIPDNLKTKSSQLTRLSLSGGGLTAFPIAVYNLKQLETLNLGCNEIKTIPDGIRKLSNLKTLNMNGGACGGNPITSISSELATLEQLEDFSVSHANLKTLPNQFFFLPNLKSIKLWYAGIEYLPEFPENSTIESFWIAADSNFQAFPKSIQYLNVKRAVIDVLYPKTGIVKTAKYAEAMRRGDADIDLSLRGIGHYFEEKQPWNGFWEVVSASDGSTQLDLMIGDTASVGAYLDTRDLAFLVQNTAENMSHEHYKLYSPPARLAFRPMFVENVVFGQKAEGRNMGGSDKRFDGEYLYYEYEVSADQKTMTIINEAGVKYTLKKLY
ncbi:MAG: leucine-rich repeat domain-containing protein [Bacteroidota bacterium]